MPTWNGFVVFWGGNDDHNEVDLGGKKKQEPPVGEEFASCGDILFDCIGLDGLAYDGVSFDEGCSTAGKEVVLCGGDWDLGTGVS